MPTIEKIGGISGRVFNPVEAVKLYATTNNRINTMPSADIKKSFQGARQWGLLDNNYNDYGQFNGLPAPYYVKDKTGALVEGTRTMDFFC